MNTQNKLQEIQILILSLPCTHNKEFMTIIKDYEMNSSVDHIISLFDSIFSIAKYTNTEVYHFLNVFSKFIDCVGPNNLRSLSSKVRSLKFFPSEKDTDLVIVKYFEVINKMSLIMESDELHDVYSRYVFLQSKDIITNIMVHFIYAKFKDFLFMHPSFLTYSIEKGLFKEMRLKNEFVMDYYDKFTKPLLIDSTFDMNLGLRLFIINNTKDKYLFQEFFNDIPQWYIKSLTPHIVPFLYYNFDIYGIYRELALEFCNKLNIDEFIRYLQGDVCYCLCKDKDVEDCLCTDKDVKTCLCKEKRDVKDCLCKEKSDVEDCLCKEKSDVEDCLCTQTNSLSLSPSMSPSLPTYIYHPSNSNITDLRNHLKDSIALFNKTLDLNPLISRFGQLESMLLLRLCKSTNLKSLGEFLCKSKNEDYLLLFTSTFDFLNLSLIEALRTYLASFFLVGESQVIHRVLTIFSEKYFIDNLQNDFLIDDEKTRRFIFNFSFSLLVLNTKLYNPNLKSKPTFQRHMADFTEDEIPSNFSMEYLESQFENVCEQKMELAIRNKAGRQHFMIYEKVCGMYSIPMEFVGSNECVESREGDCKVGSEGECLKEKTCLCKKGACLCFKEGECLKEETYSYSKKKDDPTNLYPYNLNPSNSIPYSTTLLCWKYLFRKVASNFLDDSPEKFYSICIRLNETGLISRYLRENKNDTGRFLSMFKFYSPLEGDLEIYKFLIGVLKRIEKPRHGVFSEIKNSLIKAPCEVRDTILTQYRKAFYELAESSFKDINLLGEAVQEKNSSSFILSLITEIYLCHLDSIKDLSMLPDEKISLILDRLVTSGNRPKFSDLCKFMSPENLLIYYKNMLETVPRFLNKEICESFKKIEIYNEDAFCILLNIQKEFDLFDYAVELHEEKIECRGVNAYFNDEGEYSTEGGSKLKDQDGAFVKEDVIVDQNDEKVGRRDDTKSQDDIVGQKETKDHKDLIDRNDEKNQNDEGTASDQKSTNALPQQSSSSVHPIFLFKKDDFSIPILNPSILLFQIDSSKDILGCYSFKEKFDEIMRIPTNLFHFYASSKSILNQSKAKTIHKTGCPLKEDIFSPLEMDSRLIYMIKKADTLNNKDVTNYTLWVINLISSSLPLFCRFFVEYFGLLLTIKNMSNPIIKIFCSRLSKSLSGSPLCCKCGFNDLSLIEKLIKFLIKYDLASVKDFDFYFTIRNEKINNGEIRVEGDGLYLELP